jgi:hypothetical protein
MIFLNLKKKKLNNIYNKIAEQSKNSFFFKKKKLFKFDSLLEFFQLNLIFILWYMRFKKIKMENLNFLINKFFNDLELSIVELGFSETSMRKKMRIIAENFYGRLYSYSSVFDEIQCKKKRNSVKSTIIKNFNNKEVNLKCLVNYLIENVIYFKKLEEEDFWKLNFNFENLKG